MPLTLLSLAPPETLRFANRKCFLALTNTSEGHVAYKVKVKTPQNYTVQKRSTGTLKPGDGARVDITQLAPDKDIEGNRFVVQAVAVEGSELVSREDWARLAEDKARLQEKKLTASTAVPAPLQVHAHVERGSITVVCTNLRGEVLSRIGGLSAQENGTILANHIRLGVPAPTGAFWRLVLPNGEILEGERASMPLWQLFESDLGSSIEECLEAARWESKCRELERNASTLEQDMQRLEVELRAAPKAREAFSMAMVAGAFLLALLASYATKLLA